MKQLIFCATLLLFMAFVAPAWACDCDTAAALTGGMKDRLHQPWPNDPELLKEKQKTAPDNGPKQELPTGNQDDRSNRDNRK